VIVAFGSAFVTVALDTIIRRKRGKRNYLGLFYSKKK